MRVLLVLAHKELRDGLRNRWIAAAIVLLAGLALSLALLGSAPVGAVKADPLSVTVASLSSLTVYLLPLMALLLAYDALVGEAERGTLTLLLAYPVARWQVVLGKFVGHTAILALAILIGYGCAGLVVTFTTDAGTAGWGAFAGMMASSLLLGAAFLALGYLPSAVVRERATAAGIAIGLWLLFVVLYDLGLLGLLVVDQGQTLGQSVIGLLMMINPTDAYRLFNLAGTESVSLVSGMAGVVAKTGLSAALLLLVLLAWSALPLLVTVLLFRRKEI